MTTKEQRDRMIREGSSSQDDLRALVAHIDELEASRSRIYQECEQICEIAQADHHGADECRRRIMARRKRFKQQRYELEGQFAAARKQGILEAVRSLEELQQEVKGRSGRSELYYAVGGIRDRIFRLTTAAAETGWVQTAGPTELPTGAPLKRALDHDRDATLSEAVAACEAIMMDYHNTGRGMAYYAAEVCRDRIAALRAPAAESPAAGEGEEARK